MSEDDYLEDYDYEEEDEEGELDCLHPDLRAIHDRMMQAITSSPDIAVEPAPVEAVGLIGKGEPKGEGLLAFMGASNVIPLR